MFTQSSRVTERKNPLSRSLDGSLSAERFLKVLQACDSQIYSGFEDYNSIFDNGIIYQMLRVSEMIAQMLTNGGLVISMGCGTSGRIAYMVSKRYQDLLKNTNIDYICAAGDSALLLSDEMPEDDPLLGIKDVHTLITQRRCSAAYIIGITCGLSAPYVAGPLALALAQSNKYRMRQSPNRRLSHGHKSTPLSTPSKDRLENNDGMESLEKVPLSSIPIGAACIGFNPISDARHIPLRRIHSVEGHQATVNTFKDLMEWLAGYVHDDSVNGTTVDNNGDSTDCITKHALINPVLGPEPVTGSSRMKGGSATMMLLDIMMLKGIYQAHTNNNPTSTPSTGPTSSFTSYKVEDDEGMKSILSLGALSVSDLLLEYQRLHAHTYHAAQEYLPLIMRRAGESIRKKGRILYMGLGSAGALGCIDASEMPDTYGDSFESIRGFVYGGWGSGTLPTENDTPGGKDVDTSKYGGLGNREGDLSSTSSLHRICFDAFAEDILPSLTHDDHVILLLSDPLGSDKGQGKGRNIEGLQSMLELVKSICATCCSTSLLISAFESWSTLMGEKTLGEIVKVITMNYSNKHTDVDDDVEAQEKDEEYDQAWMACPAIVFVPQQHPHIGFSDYSLKLLTNAISTYAQAYGRGALYHSMMISAGPANDKIYCRCVSIISENVGVSMITAEVALICSIHHLDWHTLSIEEKHKFISMSRDEHILQSIPRMDARSTTSSIVPIAVLLAGNFKGVKDIFYVTNHPTDFKGISYEAASQLVVAEPNLKQLLEQYAFARIDANCDDDNAKAGNSTDLLPPLAHILGLTTTGGLSRPPVAVTNTKSRPSFDPSQYCVGVDLGGTNIRAGVVHLPTGKLLAIHKQLLPTQAKGDPNVILDLIEMLYVRCLSELSQSLSTQRKDSGISEEEEIVIQVGEIVLAIGQPGLVDAEGSISGLAAFPEWGPYEPFPLKGYLSMVLAKGLLGREVEIGDEIDPTSRSQHVYVFDDANSALQAEISYGIARLEPGPVVMVTVGTGVGMAVHLPGYGILKGHRGLIEGGHSIIMAQPPSATPSANTSEGNARSEFGSDTPRVCKCGQLGCLESFACGSSLEYLAQLYDQNTTSTAVLQCCARYLTIGILNAIRHYDPSMVIVGGGMAPLLYPYVIHQYRSVQWHLYDDLEQGGVDLTLGQWEESGVLGAAACMREERMKERAREKKRSDGNDNDSKGRRCTLRIATEADRQALYNVCLLTGDAGQDATPLYTDPSLLGSIYVGPYLDEQNITRFAYALVCPAGDKSDREEVVGYVLAALDTVTFHKQCELGGNGGPDAAWWPALRTKYDKQGAMYNALRENEKQLVDREIFREHRLDPESDSRSTVSSSDDKGGSDDDLSYAQICSLYPSHLHIDIISAFQGNSYGTVLMLKILRRLRQGGSKGVHLGMHYSNQRAFQFYTQKLGFAKVGEAGEEWILALALGL